MIRSILTLLCVLTLTSFAGDNMKAFPPAEAGMVRYVLPMEKQANEGALKVELIVGKTVKTDGVNRHFFGGKLEVEAIQGWGFDRYVLKSIGPMAGTLMGPPPGAPKVEKFVTLGGEPYLVRYNSRLPLVIYVPEGVEVRYRVWRADPDSKVAAKG